MKIKKNFEFNHKGTKLNLLIKGCFEPNLTSSIILSAAIKELTQHKNKNKKIIEIGCGCGVISSFLLKQGFFNEIDFLGISDISQQAVIVTKKNIKTSNSEVNFQNIIETPPAKVVKFRAHTNLLNRLRINKKFLLNQAK